MGKIIYWLPAIAWMVVIFGFSAQPSLRVSGVNWQDFFIRKTAHFVEYFILYFLYLFALKKTTRIKTHKVFYYALFISIIYAITDEAHQLSVFGRDGRIRDIIIDSSGAGFATFISSHLK